MKKCSSSVFSKPNTYYLNGIQGESLAKVGVRRPWSDILHAEHLAFIPVARRRNKK